MNLNQDAYNGIIEQISYEGNPRLFLPQAEIPAHDAIPAAWSRILAQPDAHKLVLSELWAPVRSFLPVTVAALEKNLRGVALLLTDSHPPSLLYLFGLDLASLYAHRGYVPAAALPDLDVRLSADLLPFYQLHDGWVDFFSNDFGPYPISEWKRIGLDDDGKGGFLNVFGSGSNALGFDLTDGQSYALWTNDGEVEPIADFWNELDEWVGGQLKDIGDK